MDQVFEKINRFVPARWRWILRHAGFRKYFKNTGWMFAGQMSTLVVAFFVGAWIARYLGPDKYGSLNYIISFVGLFSFLSSLGLEGILSRAIIRSPENKEKLLGTGLVLKIVGAIIAILLISITTFLTNKDILTNILIILFSTTFIFQSFSVISIYFQSQVLAKNTAKVQVISTFLSALLKVAFILSELDIIWFILSYVIDSLILAIGFIVIFSKDNGSILKWKFDIALAKKLMIDSWPLFFALFSALLFSRIDQVMINHYLGNTALGIYSAAVKLSEVWYFVPGLICTSLFPAIINSKDTDQHIYMDRLKRLYGLMFWLAVIIATLFTVFSAFLVKTIFGTAYSGAIDVLQIYVWAGIAVALGAVASNYLIAENYVKISLFINLFAAASNILLNLILIPTYGIIGAAWATLISYSLLLLLLAFFKKTRNQLYLMFRSILYP